MQQVDEAFRIKQMTGQKDLENTETVEQRDGEGQEGKMMKD